MRNGNWIRRLWPVAALGLAALALAIFWPTREAQSLTRDGYWYASELNGRLFDDLQVTGLTYDAGHQRFYALVTSGDGPLRLMALSSQFEPLETWPEAVTLADPLPLFNEADGRLYLLDRSGDCCRLYSLLPGQSQLRAEGRLALNAAPLAAAFDRQGGLNLAQSDSAQPGRLSLARFDRNAYGAGRPAATHTTQSDIAVAAARLTDSDLAAADVALVRDLQIQLAGANTARSSNVLQLSRQVAEGSEPLNAVIAPSLDSTDDEATLSLYVVGPNSVFEIAYQPAATRLPPTTVSVPLVTSTDTWQWSPPSPDPAGITYLPGSGELLVADSEVNEVAIYAGANLFLAGTNGMLSGTDDTTGFSDEPTGITVNPANGHIFISDDDQQEFYHLSDLPGAGTLIRTVETQGSGSGDPEGIAYDPVNGHLFVVDGRDSEVYIFTASGDPVDHFDVGTMGLSDPEGITYDDLTGHFLVLDSSDGQVVEVTREGQLVREIELSAPNLDKPAGLVYGPTSSNATARTLYVVDRQTDNNDDSSENDGILFEFLVPVDEELTATPTHTTAPPTETPVPPTHTPVPPTNTPVTPTDTPVPPTNTPSPTATFALVTDTPVPPTDTPVPPTATNAPPTATGSPPPPTATPEILPTDTPTSTPPPSPTATATSEVPPSPTATPERNERYRNHFPMVALQRFNPLAEENDNCTAAYPLLTNREYRFLAEDRDDWYRFTTHEQGEITVRVTNFAPQSGQVAVYRGAGCGSATFIANYGNNGEEKILQLGAQEPGSFYLYISNDGPLNNQALYSLIVQTR